MERARRYARERARRLREASLCRDCQAALDRKGVVCAGCLAYRRARYGKPSAVQLRALAFIEAHPEGFTASEFADHLWDTASMQPHAVGKTGGSYLWRLEAMGLITEDRRRLTAKGRERLSGRELAEGTNE